MQGLPSVCLAVDQRPFLYRMPIAGLPVRVVGFQSERRFDDKVDGGFVLKSHVNAVVFAHGEKLNVVQGFAFGFFKAVEGASGEAAYGGLAALGDRGAQRFWKALPFFSFLGASVFWGGMLVGAELRRGNGAFIFNSSHVALLTGDLVRARSVV